jgi:hypothetical protein
MHATVTKAWATPSVLHLRLLVQSNKGRWSQFLDVHVPWDNLDPEVLSRAFELAGSDSQPPDAPTLF